MPKRANQKNRLLNDLNEFLRTPMGETLNELVREVFGLPEKEGQPKVSQAAQELAEKLKRHMASNPYQILGLDTSAEEVVVRAVYRAKAKICHPDAPGGSTSKFKQMDEAYHRICQERGWKP